jgi:hypothetical protein
MNVNNPHILMLPYTQIENTVKFEYISPDKPRAAYMLIC